MKKWEGHEGDVEAGLKPASGGKAPVPEKTKNPVAFFPGAVI
jgi:hypothetical protein